MTMITRCACGALLAATTAALAIVGCATARSASDYDTTAKFTSYTTFTIMTRERGTSDDAPAILLAEHSIKARLQSKGFQLVDNPQRADFVVDFTLGSADRTDIRRYPEPYAGHWFWDARLRGGPYWGPAIDPQVYRAGVLSIDVFDPGTHRPVWHGWSKDAIQPTDAAVSDVLSWFPPGHMQ